jgi:hypothetical protein
MGVMRLTHPAELGRVERNADGISGSIFSLFGRFDYTESVVPKLFGVTLSVP